MKTVHQLSSKILSKLRCFECGAGGISLLPLSNENSGTESPKLQCAACGKIYLIRKGIVDFLISPSVTVVSEVSGWQRYHTPERNPEQFRDEWLLKLPRIDSNVSLDANSVKAWSQHADNFDLAVKKLMLKGTEEMLELGAGRCWAAAAFAKHGCSVVALDVVRDKYIGLESGEIYLRHGPFFDRVLSDMERLPFADESFDIVFSTATLHHAPDLQKLCLEASRVLRPGGRFVAINDTVAGYLDAAQDLEEIELGINEHAYFITSYKKAMSRAGLHPKLFMPAEWRKRLESGRHEMRHPLKIIAFKLCSFLWKVEFFKEPLEYFLLNWAQLLLGIGLNTIALKRARL